MDTLYGRERGQGSYLRANSLLWLVSAGAGVSLVAAAGVTVVEAQSETRPFLQIPSVLLTLVAGGLAFYGGSFAVGGRRAPAQALWAACILVAVLPSLLQALPIQYNTLALLYLIDFSPPIWPYAAAIPLLVFLLLEVSLPGLEGNRTSYVFLSVGLASAVMLLFFATALIGEVANGSILIALPHYLFLSLLAPIGLSSLIVLAVVLVRKGWAAVGIALLLALGLGIEWMSTRYYSGPRFLEEASWMQFANYPLLPVLAGTIPGVLATAAGVLAGWEVYLRGGKGDENGHGSEGV